MVEVTAGWQVAAFASVVPVLVACACYALAAAHRHALKEEDARCGAQASPLAEDAAAGAEDFITARGSVDVWKLAFSFYASAMGSWVVTGPPIYASTAGLLGLASYAVASGVPLAAMAWAGGLARTADPDASSMPDFLRRRFGGGLTRRQGAAGLDGLLSSGADAESDGAESELLAEGRPGRWLRPGSCIAALSAVVTLFCMAIAMLAEYATFGTLFRSFVGCTRNVAVLPTVLMAILTIGYTMAGGLYVSILTDRVQAVVSLLLVSVLAAYLASAFEPPAGGLPPLSDEQRGYSYAGYSSIFTMPLSLMCSTLYSEALWQRVWAAEDSQTLQRASCIGAVAVSVVVAFFGFVGFLAIWAGRATADTDPNLYFFALFSSSSPAKLDSLPGLLALVCAALMSEGAVDSLQNGITATLSSTLLKGRPLCATRLLVLAANVPLALLGASSLVNNVLTLFLMANMTAVVCAPPLALSLLTGRWARELVTEGTVVFGCFGGAVGVSLYGVVRGGGMSEGLRLAWMTNNYGWDYFLAAVLSSGGCCALGVAASCARRTLRTRGHRARIIQLSGGRA